MRVWFAPKGDLRVASSRYRVFDVARCLTSAGHSTSIRQPELIETSWFGRGLRFIRDLGFATMARPDLLVLQRPGRRREAVAIARVVKWLHGRIVVDVDDPLDWSNPVTARCLDLADAVVVGSKQLQAALPDAVQTKSVVGTTPIDLRLYPAPNYRLPADCLRLIWIGDGATHGAVLADLVDHLCNFLADWPASLDLIGLRANFPGTSVAVLTEPDWGNEAAVARSLMGYHVGLAPYRGRPGAVFKVLQYLASGTVPLVDVRGAGMAYLEPLADDIRSMCVVDYSSNDEIVGALAAIGELAGDDRSWQELREELRRAAGNFRTELFASQMLGLASRWS